uniref:Structure-specific endonuclease subunit SLX4 n=1 Tax=Glossina brevipalpis TaxID=37001 RepID=A0A1A9W546_9MUSC
MDRETRKANLKKLQLPSTKSHKIRDPSNTITATTTTISNYFITPEKRKPAAVNEIVKESHQSLNEDNTAYSSNHRKRTKLNAFVGSGPGVVHNTFKETEIRAHVNENDFAEPLERLKKAPDLIKAKQIVRKIKRNKKQTSIKSAFLRNEQMFAEIASQHCAADQFDGEEIQLALAISQSEAESKCLQQALDDDKSIVDVDVMQNNTESIRKKLEKYGFRTADKKDYYSFATVFAAANTGRRKKCRWANKFTPLTLRNAKTQNKKVENNVDSLIKRQFQQKPFKSEENLPKPSYSVLSALLKPMHSKGEELLLYKATTVATDSLEYYFVKELFEVKILPSNYLLKDWSAIQGRDSSPSPEQKENHLAQNLKLQIIYNELETYFNHNQSNNNEIGETQILSSDSMLLRTNNNANQHLNSPVSKKTLNIETTISVAHRSLRSNSPDLFADSESDGEIEDKTSSSASAAGSKQFNDLIGKDNNTNFVQDVDGVITYETYTSDDVKNPTLLELFKTTAHVTLEHHLNDSKHELEKIDLFELSESESKEISFENFLVTNSLNETEKISEFILNMETEHHNSENHEEPPNKRERTSYVSEELKEKSFEITLNLGLRKSPTIAISEEGVSVEDDEEIFQELKRKYLTQTTANNSYISGNNNLRKSFSFSCKTHITPKTQSFHKTSSFDSQIDKKVSELDISIDLTQDDNTESDIQSDDCLLLSDDEINYSIWKSHRANGNLDEHEKNNTIFSTLDFRDTEGHNVISQETQNSFFEVEYNKNFLQETFSLDSGPHVSTQTVEKLDFSFLDSSSEKLVPIKQFGQNFNKKFQSLWQSNISQTKSDSTPSSYRDDLDEIDLLLETGPSPPMTVPKDLDQLLEGEISYLGTRRQKTPTKSKFSNESSICDYQELELNGKIFAVREVNTPKPDFSTLTETELLKRLYRYGIKRLKRKQAVKILEYIYNQSHPIIGYGEENVTKNFIDINSPSKIETTQITTNPISTRDNRYNISDGSGKQMLRYNNELKAEFLDEQFILQTNVTKKTPRPLLPFHIAWYNLLCSNRKLHESILMYEPIDLQGVYLFLKDLGYRYDPKDLKAFFDRRCIIFRYDLSPPVVGSHSQQRNRHIRKQKFTQFHVYICTFLYVDSLSPLYIELLIKSTTTT